MANYERTTRWGFATRRTDVATNTALATATRFEFGAKTITAETSRVVRSAFLVIKLMDVEPTTATDFDAIRVGANVASAGFTDVDTTLVPVDSGENETLDWIADITSNVVANSGSGSTFTLDVAVAVATEAATNIRSITCELHLTYSASDGAAAHLKTVLIPLMAGIRLLTNAYTEQGSQDAGAAATSQIPQLTGAGSPFLPESSITIKDQYIIVTGVANPAGTADETLTARLDGSTDITLSIHENALLTSNPISEIISSSEQASTSAAHAFELKSSVTNSFRNMGGVLVVTYQYDPASTTHLNSVVVPLSADAQQYDGGTETVPMRMIGRLHIQEPGPILPKQSGAVLHHPISAIAGTYNVSAEGQTARPYDGDTGYVYIATTELVHRLDGAQSPWDLARGWNEIKVDWSMTTFQTNWTGATGYAIVNYHSALATAGCRAHNRSTWWFHLANRGLNSASWQDYTPTAPTITDDYKISGVLLDTAGRANNPVYAFALKNNVDDDGGVGTRRVKRLLSIYAEMGTKRAAFDYTEAFRAESAAVEAQAYGADVEVSHTFTAQIEQNTLTSCMAAMCVTYHQISKTFTGTYTVDGANQTATDVDIYAIDEIEDTSMRVGTVTTDGSGVFTKEVFDDTLKYCAHCPVTGHGSKLGYVAANIDTPSIRSVGVATAVASGASSPAFGKHRKYDVSYLVIVGSSGETLSLSSAQGFTQIADSPQNATGAKIAVFEKLHTSKNATPPTITATTDFHAARIITVRGAHRTTPIDVTNGDTAATSTSVTMPNDTTTVDNTLVMNFLTNGTDSATLQTTAWANAALAFFREVMAANTALGGGGGYSVAAGKKLVAGAIGGSTATLGTTSTQGRITAAIKPHVPTAEANFNITGFSSGPAGGGGFAASQVYGGIGV